MGFKYGNWIQAMCVFAVAVWFGRVRSPSDRVRKRAFDMPLGRFSQQKVHFFIRSIPFSTELWFDSHAPSVYCLRDWGAAMVALHWFISIASNQKSPILSIRLFFFFFFFLFVFSFHFICCLNPWNWLISNAWYRDQSHTQSAFFTFSISLSSTKNWRNKNKTRQ